MSKLYLFLCTGIMLCINADIEAQDLLLVHGKKLRTIEAGSFIQIELPRPDVASCKRCPLNMITGKLVEATRDSLIIQILESKESLVNKEENIGYAYKKYASEKYGPIIYISKTDVLSIVVKGKKSMQPKHPLDVVGNALTSLGIIAVFINSISEERSEVVDVVSASAIIGGALLANLVRQPFYMTSTESSYKTFNGPETSSMYGREIWKLN